MPRQRKPQRAKSNQSDTLDDKSFLWRHYEKVLGFILGSLGTFFTVYSLDLAHTSNDAADKANVLTAEGNEISREALRSDDSLTVSVPTYAASVPNVVMPKGYRHFSEAMQEDAHSTLSQEALDYIGRSVNRLVFSAHDLAGAAYLYQQIPIRVVCTGSNAAFIMKDVGILVETTENGYAFAYELDYLGRTQGDVFTTGTTSVVHLKPTLTNGTAGAPTTESLELIADLKRAKYSPGLVYGEGLRDKDYAIVTMTFSAFTSSGQPMFAKLKYAVSAFEHTAGRLAVVVNPPEAIEVLRSLPATEFQPGTTELRPVFMTAEVLDPTKVETSLNLRRQQQ